MSKPPSLMVDLEDRDPNSLSHHLQVSWEEVIGEPETIRSPECAWKVSNQCFTISKNLCYTSLSVLLAPIMALCLGCAFACLAFELHWFLDVCMSCGVCRWHWDLFEPVENTE